ncbi:MAG: phage antirepressor N-terminal domain-containing protein [Bacteroidota bacterium]|nr:phage antirepressor N-terminal domain-containing protein [Bacteroidota bacterium]
MNENTGKFLKFNGKRIVMLGKNGTWWIAIKPICEALGVNYNRQFQNLKNNRILNQLFAEQQMVAADDKLRKMVCLPEFAIYGWIFQIESNAPGLEDFQWECYHVLYEHFHGSITGRKELLSEKVKAQVEIRRCMNTMDPDVSYLYQQAHMKIIQINNKLRKSDKEVLEKEKTLFDT